MGDLVPIILPPGVWKNGTIYQAKGRWFNSNLVRFYAGAVRPWGGWLQFSASAMTGKCRRVMDWIDAAGLLWLMAGTESHLYAYDSAGDLFDITPAGLITGRPDATNTGGYGGGTYGSGTYGNARGATSTILPATVWHLATMEQTPFACNSDDGAIYTWDLNTGHVATVVSGAPINNRGILVTQEGFLMALGAGGDPRSVQWCDQSAPTVWTPTALNQARSYALQTPGRIMSGAALKSGALIWTDTDVHLATFYGLPFVYTFDRQGSECGIIGPAAFAVGDEMAAWMSLNSFWSYNGQVQPVESDVSDYVFGNMNLLQRSKTHAVHNATFGEFTWFYVSNASSEIDSYVTWNYREGHWAVGSLVRTASMAAGILTNPVFVDGASIPWSHETGFSYNSEGTPFAETGPAEFDWNYYGATTQGAHPGERTYDVLGMVPDTITLGDVQMTAFCRFYPDGPETSFGPFSAANPTNLRFPARETRFRFTGASASDFRIGIPRFEVAQAGKR